MAPIVLAAAAHPDDIEYLMAGTLLHLKEAGASLHYLNIANGCFGTNRQTRDEITAMRLAEARRAAELLGATFHPPLANDMEIVYDLTLLRRLAALVREVQPDILLLQSTNDYMEDHINSARLMASAAFTRSMVNYETIPPRPSYDKDLAVYHAMPVGLSGALREPIEPHFHVDVTAVLQQKCRLLDCHESQKAWLDTTQALDSFADSLLEQDAEMGRRSGVFKHAEGWRRHSHRGFGPPDYDPLVAALPPELVHPGGAPVAPNQKK